MRPISSNLVPELIDRSPCSLISSRPHYCCRPDITKAKTMLGWEPKVQLREGLKFMVDDFSKRLGIAVKKQKL